MMEPEVHLIEYDQSRSPPCVEYLITDRCDSNEISYFQMEIPLNKFPLETSFELPVCF